jgi:HPt (histidine-containing phosphotransfer) domain-containing protein
MDDQFQTLAMLESRVGREKIVQLLAGHRTNVDDAIGQIAAMTAEPDIDTLKFIAHRMIGSCGSLGFSRISTIFAELEAAAIAGRMAVLAELTAKLNAENGALNEAVHARYPEIASGTAS